MPEATAVSVEESAKTKISTDLRIIGYLLCIGAGVSFIRGIVTIGKTPLLQVLVNLVFGLGMGFLGWAWFKGKKWAWYAAIVLFSLNIIWTLLIGNWLVAVINAAMIYCSARRNARMYFGVSR